MVTESKGLEYWYSRLNVNDEETSSMSRILNMLDILDAGGVHDRLDGTRNEHAVAREEMESILDPSNFIKSSIFRRRGKWWIEYDLNGRKVTAPLRTKFRHIARIKQEEIEAILAGRAGVAV